MTCECNNLLELCKSITFCKTSLSLASMFSLSFSDGINDLIPSVLPILVKGGKLFLVLSILDSCPNNSFSYNLLNSLN